jgi:hypothetical protein
VSLTASEIENEGNSQGYSIANALKLNYMHFGPNIRERELKRRYNEIS